ncbi:MAG: deoxyribodipyrimidine photolyase, partial [Gemmatimonadales bacterium]|nr:deoxyribodipyrimidine photolyase [Gemmatimonadales bacterium]
LDGRDSSTWGNVLWVCGKFDRPFYRRPIYSTVRYTSLKATYGKFDAAAYIARHAPL